MRVVTQWKCHRMMVKAMHRVMFVTYAKEGLVQGISVVQCCDGFVRNATMIFALRAFQKQGVSHDYNPS